jgi:hypothetical protein
VASLIDPSDDFAVVDNVETVTYYRRTGNATFDEGSICQSALRRDVRRQEKDAGGATLVRVDTRWHIWADDLGPGPSPKVNDVIQDSAGIRWSVVDVDEGTLQTRWRVLTVQERS